MDYITPGEQPHVRTCGGAMRGTVPFKVPSSRLIMLRKYCNPLVWTYHKTVEPRVNEHQVAWNKLLRQSSLSRFVPREQIPCWRSGCAAPLILTALWPLKSPIGDCSAFQLGPTKFKARLHPRLWGTWMKHSFVLTHSHHNESCSIPVRARHTCCYKLRSSVANALLPIEWEIWWRLISLKYGNTDCFVPVFRGHSLHVHCNRFQILICKCPGGMGIVTLEMDIFSCSYDNLRM